MLDQYGVRNVFNFESIITQHVIIPIPNDVCIIANTPIAIEMFFGVLRVILLFLFCLFARFFVLLV